MYKEPYLALTASAIFVAVAIATSTFLLSPPSVFADVNDTLTVNVTILAISRIEVNPNTIHWVDVEPGASSESTQFVDIKNTGSLNVSQIYAYVDTLTDESQRPYGIDNSTYYGAGGLIVFKNSTFDNYSFAGRIEWNWTSNISNLVRTGVTSPVSYGFFKNTSIEYVWLVGNGTPAAGDPETGIYCNGTGAQFAISDAADNGTVSTRTPAATTITRNAGDANYGYFSDNRASSPLFRNCIAISADCTKIYIYRYDKRSGFTGCLNSRYIQEGNLAPSDFAHQLTLDIYAPYGIPDGMLNVSTFTVMAT
jgi:hypothetical protein